MALSIKFKVWMKGLKIEWNFRDNLNNKFHHLISLNYSDRKWLLFYSKLSRESLNIRLVRIQSINKWNKKLSNNSSRKEKSERRRENQNLYKTLRTERAIWKENIKVQRITPTIYHQSIIITGFNLTVLFRHRNT